MKNMIRDLKDYLLLWGTQSLSALGSGMTNFALILWLYQKSGSALETALLSICSYAPYVAMSIFAGALSDRWNKKRTMLVCDSLAAACTVAVLILLRMNRLEPWHMYLLNAVNGLMNTVQAPASEVAATLLTPRRYYQQTCGLRSFSQSLNTILTPVFASALFAFSGMEVVIAVDLATFVIAFVTLLALIRIPETPRTDAPAEKLLDSARQGLRWLKGNPMVLKLILFLAFINLVASANSATLPAMVIPRENGGETALGLVNTFIGVATLLGSLLATWLPAPRDRIRVVHRAMLFSMSTENFILALTRTPPLWCFGSVLGWLPVPIMGASLDVVMRSSIPPEMQGRVYACRNTLQFFTIPIGYFLGGLLVDKAFEPLMARTPAASLLARLVGTGKGSGAALMMLVLGFAGVAVCLIFGVLLRKYHWTDER